MTIIWAAIGWLMDYIFNPRGYYADGKPFRTFREIYVSEVQHAVEKRDAS